MKQIRIYFFLYLFSSVSFAEVLSVPENCFHLEISPCLIKAEQQVALSNTNQDFRLGLNENSIVKIKHFNQPTEVEILQGSLFIQALKNKAMSVKLNDVNFDSKMVFVQLKEKKIVALDTKNFILSEFENNFNREQETVILKSDFPVKSEMVAFVSKFFLGKKELVSFLKSIEVSWQKEFHKQIKHQTKVLERSVASMAKDEAEEKKRKSAEALELKKVRSLFFYRTFYR